MIGVERTDVKSTAIHLPGMNHAVVNHVMGKVARGVTTTAIVNRRLDQWKVFAKIDVERWDGPGGFRMLGLLCHLKYFLALVYQDYARATKDTEILTEYVRHAMARSITQMNVQNGVLPCVTLDPALENRIAGGVQRTDHGSYVSLDPDAMQKLLQTLDTELTKLTNMGYQPIVLTSPAVRLYFRKLVERSVPGLIVLSHAEIEASVEIQILGVVKI